MVVTHYPEALCFGVLMPVIRAASRVTTKQNTPMPVIRVASRGMLGSFPNIVMFVLNVRFIINDLTRFDASY